jgi:hypothetical protein
MEIYKIGPNDLEDYELNHIDPEKYKWVVYHYVIGSYDGSGELVALPKKPDGFLRCINLSHCSCYGPLERFSPTKIRIVDFIKGPDNHIDDDYSLVRDKVLELLKDEPLEV